MAVSVTEICNRALQRLGANTITVITGDSVEAIECNRCYTMLRNAELRAHTWSFAKARAQLAASSTAPAFGFDNAFPVPSDFLRLILHKDNLDWQIEGSEILTNDGAPLNVHYVRVVENSGLFDPLFDDALSARMAMEMCEKLTQSNSKYNLARQAYLDTITTARRVNAIERSPADPSDDSWVTIRR